MTRPLSLRWSVLFLALICVAAAEGVAFTLLLAMPVPTTPGMTPREIADAFRRVESLEPAVGLRGQIEDVAPFVRPVRGYPLLVGRTLEALLDHTDAKEVRIRALSSVVALQAGRPLPTARAFAAIATNPRQALTLADAPFPAFEAAISRGDGRWIVIGPVTPWLSPDSVRLLAAFVISLMLVAPFIAVVVRKLSLPLETLAQAAALLGRGTVATPLKVTGPREVGAAASAFNAMGTRLAAQADERATLMAAMAHDLRTPLTSLRLRVEAAPPLPRARMVADISRMEALVADLITFVGGNHTNAERRPVDLGSLAAECVAEMRERGVASTYERGGEAQVLVEPAAMRRAVENLLQNAHLYAGPSTVRVGADRDLCWLTVTDGGPGIGETDLDRVFEPFVRLEKSRSRATGGAGLGLAIARGVARGHGGNLCLRNLSPQGLEAKLTLPMLGGEWSSARKGFGKIS